MPLISDSIKAGAFEQATRRIAPVGSSLQKFLLWCIPNSVKGTRKNHLDYSRQKILKYVLTSVWTYTVAYESSTGVCNRPTASTKTFFTTS